MVELKSLALVHRYSLDFAGLIECPYMCPWEVIFHRRMSSLTTGMLHRIVHALYALNQSLSSTGLYSSNSAMCFFFFNNPLSPYPHFQVSGSEDFNGICRCTAERIGGPLWLKLRLISQMQCSPWDCCCIVCTYIFYWWVFMSVYCILHIYLQWLTLWSILVVSNSMLQ